MRNFQEKRKLKHVIQSVPVLILLTVVLLFFAWGIYGFVGKMLETMKNRQIAEDKITELQQKKDKLSFDIAKLKTEEGVEESIRNKFGLAKEGEGMIVVVDDKNLPEDTTSPQGQGFWHYLKNLFK